MNTRPVALITGGRRGIGKAIALALADAGFAIAITDYAPSDELDDACNAVAKIGASLAVISDLARITGHDQLLDTVEARLGPITCLVNNAGVSVENRGDMLDVTPQSYDRCLNVNTRGTFFLTQAFGKRIASRQMRGLQDNATALSVITITSSNAVAASPERSEYCISKAGASMATTLFALRFAELGISVYEVQPGFIETEMTAPSKARYDNLMQGGLTAIHRWGTAQEVGKTVRTLATGGLPYSVGQAIKVDGGLLVHKY